MTKNKIKLITMLTATMLVATGCSTENANNSSKEEDKLEIVTSFYPMYLLTANIVKDVPNVQLENLTQVDTGCLHDYSLTTNDMKKIENSDVMVVNGAGMEAFIDKAIEQAPELKIIESSEGIKLIESEHGHSHEGESCEVHDHEEHNHDEEAHKDHNHEEHNHDEEVHKDHDHEEHNHDEEIHEEHNHEDESCEGHSHESNPHVWLSIPNAIKQVENIKNELMVIDPENAKQYEKNANEYINKLSEQDRKMHEELKDIKNRNIVTFHEAFPYFAEEFDLNIVSVVQREAGSQPNAKELQETIDTINELEVNAIFVEPQYSTKVAETIAKETGVQVYTLDPIVTAENMDTDAYIDIMDKNLEVLKEALK